MLFWDRVKMAAAVLRGDSQLALPEAGRSSEETLSSSMSAFLQSYGSISPVINFEMLRTLKTLWLFNPDFSQYVANIVNLGNPGHTLSVEAATDAKAESAAGRLNESALRLYPQSCGIDGLITQYLASVAWSGAISSEDVVNLAARRVERVVLVPVEQIRFKYNKDLDTYEPYQKSHSLVRSGRAGDLGLIKLNTETYKYFALSTIENSPYAKPPGSAAVDPIINGQKPLMENLQYIAQRYGLLAVLTAGVTPPTKLPNESATEYQTRCRTYLQSVTKVLAENISKGLLVTYKDTKLDSTSLTAGAAGLYDVNRISEEQVFSGLAAMPGFHGRTDSTTETFADVVYYLLTAQVAGMQRIVKRRVEATYNLDMRLGGIDAEANVQFNKAHSRNAKDEAMTKQIQFQDVFARVEAGAISPDEGAQELGYSSWFDPQLLAAKTGILAPQPAVSSQSARKILTLSFDRASQRYRYEPDRYEIRSFDEEEEPTRSGNVVPLKKKTIGKVAGV